MSPSLVRSILLVLALLAAPAAAQRDFYVGVRAVSADLGVTQSIREFDDDGDIRVLRGPETHGTLWGVFGGIPLNRHLAFELGYLDLGTSDAVFDPCPPCVSIVAPDTLHEMRVSALTAHALILLPTRGGLFSVGAKVGLEKPSVTIEQTLLAVDSSTEFGADGNLSLALGALVEVDPRGPLAVRLDYDSFPITLRADVDLFSLGLVWRFH